MTRTLVACGPLGDSPSSYSTFVPSTSVRKPSPEIPEKCTNASLPPSSGVMNPKPFSSLNHFTTPVANPNTSSQMNPDARGGAAGHCLPACFSPPFRRGTDGAGYTSHRPSRRKVQPGGASVPPSSPVPSPSVGEGCGGASYFSGSKPSAPLSLPLALPLPLPLPLPGLVPPVSSSVSSGIAVPVGAGSVNDSSPPSV